MAVVSTDLVQLGSNEDIVSARQMVRGWAVRLGFSLVEQTKIVTAASELARNTLVHGGGGSMRIEAHNDSGRTGLRLVFEDSGPGIRDVEMALRDGYTTGTGLGLGLGGARRLSHDFQIDSTPGQGTRVSITRWRS